MCQKQARWKLDCVYLWTFFVALNTPCLPVVHCLRPLLTLSQVIEQDSRRRIQLPVTRSLAQLQAFSQLPTLRNSAADSPGAELAAQAWGVIHRNYYYTDSEKYRLVEHVASVHNKVVARMAARDESKLLAAALAFLLFLSAFGREPY